MTALRALALALRSLLYPPACLLCGRGIPEREPRLCPACAGLLEAVRPPLCLCCGREFATAESGQGHLCGDCLRQPPPFDRARAVLRYNEAAGRLVHAFKYRGRTTAAGTFAALFAASPAAADLSSPDYIIPVPLHRRRLRQRRFNQSLELARLFFPEAGDRLRPRLLERRHHTPPQAGLNGRARRVNLRGAFHCPRPEAVRGRDILVVDDVFTTGTTVGECARVLRRAGANRVEALTLARVKG